MKKISLLHLPVNIPRIIPPKKYEKNDQEITLGGYLSNGDSFVDPVIIKN